MFDLKIKLSLMIVSCVVVLGCSDTSHQPDEERNVEEKYAAPSSMNSSDDAGAQQMIEVGVVSLGAEAGGDAIVDNDIVDEDEGYAGEEFYPSEPDFSPQVREAIEIMEGRTSAPKPAPELKQEYKDVAEILESQMDGY